MENGNFLNFVTLTKHYSKGLLYGSLHVEQTCCLLLQQDEKKVKD